MNYLNLFSFASGIANFRINIVYFIVRYPVLPPYVQSNTQQATVTSVISLWRTLERFQDFNQYKLNYRSEKVYFFRCISYPFCGRKILYKFASFKGFIWMLSESKVQISCLVLANTELDLKHRLVLSCILAD